MLKSLTWNIEGLKRNYLNLKYFVDLRNPDFVFLSEPKVFCHDLHHIKDYFSNYSFYLNSEDKYDQDLPLVKNQAFGGTMVLWRKTLDSFISVHPGTTTSFLPIIYCPPGAPVSVHIALYLPTSGQESEFIEQIALLRIAIEELQEKYPESFFFLRGDSNVNINNKNRDKIFKHFCSTLDLINIPTNHKTYHHFLGNGLFDSSIDVILQSATAPNKEKVEDVLCQTHFPEIDSHHDIIFSSVSLPVDDTPLGEDHQISAPRIPNTRQKIIWADDKIVEYEEMVAPRLAKMRKDWLVPNSASTVSILLNLTNQVLSQAAAATNQHISLCSAPKPKSLKITGDFKKARQQLRKAQRDYREALKTSTASAYTANENLKHAKRVHRLQHRRQKHKEDIARDSKLFSVFTSNAVFKSIKSSKTSSAGAVPFLMVGDKKYVGSDVADGFYDSISSLKSQDHKSLQSSPNFNSWSQDYNYILQLCKNKRDIPSISIEQSTKILLRMKPTVNDFWSLTPTHFKNAGNEGYIHFNFLMNLIIMDINSASSIELNTVYALLLHKGHGKPKTSDRAYRTISTCPVVAKALDMYIHDLFIDTWNSAQAETQYQGEGSSHELAALMITETIQHSLHHSKEPVFLLFLDARSAFDTVVLQFLIRCLYFTGMDGNSLHYINNRLSNRHTYCDWDRELLGPVVDEHGLEQGGCNSSDLYKVYNNELLTTAQDLHQGVDLGNNLIVSAVGQADDVGLLSNNLFKLFNILYLVLNYCQRYLVDLCADKTKLLMMTSRTDQHFIPFNPIKIKGQNIEFSNQAEHVGVTRSCDGNLPHLLNRFVAHKKALAAVCFTGVAHSHRGNLAASVKLEKLYGEPVLLSGLASLVLTRVELNLLDQHYSTTLRNLLKAHSGTPRSFVLFMCGSLPGEALLHLRQLGLFSMITRLHQDPLNKRARHVLVTSKSSSKSWFVGLRDISLQYNLPHPLTLLENPMSKQAFKKMARSRVLDYWEIKLRQESAFLPSLTYHKPEFHSLSEPHPILWTPGSNPYEVSKAVIQSRMLSGRYRTAMLTLHWSTSRSGCCPAPTCSEVSETLEHLLLWCPHYEQTRKKLHRLWLNTSEHQVLQLVKSVLCGPPNVLLLFLLDASTHPDVISLQQFYGQQPLCIIFHLTRSWCYSIHIERSKLKGRL